MLEINEIFRSIQGESTFVGTPCSFIRLSGCNLDCRWCDTLYARTEVPTLMSVEQIVQTIAGHAPGIVEVTGGEPLCQSQTPELCRRLLESGRTVLVETNGACDISVLPDGAIRIMDIKTLSSGHASSMLLSNIGALRASDECKFVIADRDDFDWSVAYLRTHHLDQVCTVHFSAVSSALAPRQLAQWILEEGLGVRLGFQLHKWVWDPRSRGV